MTETSRVCTIKILDEINVHIVGLSKNDLKSLVEKYALYAPNYFFNPKFKLGQWNGRINFVTATGRTYLYLLDEILPLLTNCAYRVKIVDLRRPTPTIDLIDEHVFSHRMVSGTNHPIHLRDYQVNGVNSLIEHGNGLLIAATGAGKTLISAALVNAYGKLGIKTITIVPNQDLISNTKREYVMCGLDVGEFSGLHKDIEKQHVVSTWQTLKNYPQILQQFGMILVDECHGAKASVLAKLLTEYAAEIPFRFGVTGTLPKHETDQLSIKNALGPVRYSVTAADLMDKGLLSNVQIDVLQLEEDLHKEYDEFLTEHNSVIGKPPTYIQFKDGYFPDYDAEKSFLQRKNTRIEWIADLLLAKQDLKKGNTLCLVNNIAFGRKIASLIPGSIFVNGQDIKKPTDRQQVYDMFSSNDNLVVIATTQIAGTGINIKRVFNLVLVDPGKSFVRVIQSIGRGLRTADDKQFVHVTDVCSDLKYGKTHLAQRIGYYKEARYKHKKHKIEYEKDLDL